MDRILSSFKILHTEIKQNKNIKKKIEYIALKSSWPQPILEREIFPGLTYLCILVFFIIALHICEHGY